MLCSTLPVSQKVNEHVARFRVDTFSSFEWRLPFQRKAHACACAQCACQFARQRSFRVCCAPAPSCEFSHAMKLLARRATHLFADQRHRHCLQVVHIAFLIQGAYQRKGTGLQVCVLHDMRARRSLFPTAQQQDTCSRHMFRIYACDCVREEESMRQCCGKEHYLV